MSLKRFTKPTALRSLGRPLLKRFFDRFQTELAECKAKLPSDALDDDAYFKALAEVFFSPNELPPDLTQNLQAVVELEDETTVLELIEAAKARGLPIDWQQSRTSLDIVMEVWLADKSLFVRKHNEHRLLRTAKFQYWGTKTPPDARHGFSEPTPDLIELLREAIDEWCRNHDRGENTVLITPLELEGEWWFLIQHGGPMSRLAESKGNRKTETRFYRPGKDDVVVYNKERDELRIHTSTKREEELYRTQFGRRLRGDENYFEVRKCFDLEPLRQDIELALNPEGISGIEKIVFKEIEILYGGEYNERTIRKSDDLVASTEQRKKGGETFTAVPPKGTLVRAVFEIQFENTPKLRRVVVRPPDVLRVARQGDPKAVNEWLTQRGFRCLPKT